MYKFRSTGLIEFLVIYLNTDLSEQAFRLLQHM